MGFTAHPGRDVGNIQLYALSTCKACKAVRDFLDRSGAAYSSIDVDLEPLTGSENIEEDIVRFNPQDTYPTIVVNGGEEVIVGFDEEKLAQLVGRPE